VTRGRSDRRRNSTPALLPPPNSTMRPRAASYTMPCPLRAGGEVAGVTCCQVVPSQSHVSSKLSSALPPPNNTATRWASSYASPCAVRADGASAGESWVHAT
jgi:hypothetical protein